MQAEVRIERYADQGRCVAHIDGRVVFVRFALPDELVRVELDEPHDRDDRFWTGEVVEVLEPSEDRVTPAWPLAGPLAMGGGVGGADLVHVSLPGQLKWKAITVSEQMSRLGHIDVAVPIERMPGDKAAGGLNWRTRIEMIADDNGMPSMRRRGTHNRVAIDTMPLATRTLLDVAKREHVWEGGFEPGSQIRLSVPEPRGEIVDTAAADDNYAVLVDGELRAGSQLLTEQVTINGTTFDYQVDANGFWQVHRQAPIALGTHVINLVNGDGIAVSDVALADPRLAGIHFTGSTRVFQHLWREVGTHIERYHSYPRLVGETGGKDFNPARAGMGGSNMPDLQAEFNDVSFQAGTVGMARSQDPNSANSQFFIDLAPATFLDGQYTVVGQLVDGWDVLNAIKKGDPAANGSVIDPDYIVKVTVAE